VQLLSIATKQRQAETGGFFKQRHNQDILCIGALNVGTLANWRYVEHLKRMSAAYQRPIDKVPLLANLTDQVNFPAVSEA
jgi:hypothetical protein